MAARVWPTSHAKSSRLFGASVLVSVGLLFSSQLALAKFTQQGPKLIGTDTVGAEIQQGYSVSLSADGNTAIVGGPIDNSSTGAAWVYTRSNGVWTQQGSKLVGTGAVGAAEQGTSVALSADGNTAIVGGAGDSNGIGAAWVFTRSGGVWTQQGAKLVGSGVVQTPSYGTAQGASAALSADGNTAIVGGPDDNAGIGATWVFTRSVGVWTQQGAKLVGAGSDGLTFQGQSVALSADGNTVIVGGWRTAGAFIGGAWVFTRNGGVWSQQGNKLVGTGVVGAAAYQGQSVALSADGDTAFVGGFLDNNGIGATWVFTRSGGVWTQQGNKLVGTGIGGAESYQGFSVSLSADGNIALVGGWADSGDGGAAWVFTRSGGVWTQQGNKLVGTGAIGGVEEQGWSVALSGDGNTAFVGGQIDNSGIGATWVFVQPTVPFSEAVTLQMGAFATTIPPGSFAMGAPGTYSFVGVINGVNLKLLIKLTGGKTFEFGVIAQNINLTVNPVTVTLIIGNDSGMTPVTAVIR
jgi:hypothetical protein